MFFSNLLKHNPSTCMVLGGMALIFLLEIALCHHTTCFLHISPDVLIHLGGVVHSAPMNILSFIRAIFLHADIIHFMINSLAALILVRSLELLVGGRLAIIIFVSAGMISNGFSFLFHHEGNTVGASGALVAIATIFLVMDMMKTFEVIIFPCEDHIISSTRFAAFVTVATSLMPSLSGGAVDYAAHLGGVLAGLMLSLFLIMHLSFLPQKIS